MRTEINLLQKSIQKIVSQHTFSREEAKNIMDSLCREKFPETQMAAFFEAIHSRRETEEELLGFQDALRSRMIFLPQAFEDAIDTCGTGGDSKGTFNISTACAFVLASGGVRVAKHGGRSVSSKCGSADVLDALGVSMVSNPLKAAMILKEFGCVFLFAPAFNPVLRKFAQLRQELGVRTCFNVMGPLLNPAAVKNQVIGVYEQRLLPLVGGILRTVGVRNAIIVHSRDGMDEFSISAPSDYVHLNAGKIELKTISPEEVGLKLYPEDSVSGGSAIENANLIEAIFKGKPGAYRDAVLLNSAASFFVSGKAKSILEGISIAADCIDSGDTIALLNKLRKIK